MTRFLSGNFFGLISLLVLRNSQRIPMNAPVSLSQTSALEINQLLVSGLVTSPVRDFRCGKAKYKAVFTLQNSSGRFYVQWNHADWQPNQGDYLMIRGSVFSVPVNGADAGRIQAEEVHLLKRDTLHHSS